jgi:hypothetical protein
MSDLFKPSNIIDKPIETGDCGVILRKDGSFQIFSTGEIDPNNLTDRQVEQSTLLMAITICFNLPELKQSLIKLATDPGVLQKVKIHSMTH